MAALFHGEDGERVTRDLRKAAGRGVPLDVTARLVERGGRFRWFSLALHGAGASPGHEPAGFCIATDIDAAVRRQGELEALLAVRTEMLDRSIDCIKMITPDGILTHMNRAGCRSLGLPEDSPFGMPWLSLLPENVRQAGESALAVARTGTASRFAGRSVLPGEEECFWDNLLTPVLAADGSIGSILCVSRDVSAEHAAVISLKESEERLAIAARVGGLGIWDYDIPGDRLSCDESWYRIMGRDKHTPIHTVAEFRPFVHPEDVERATEITAAAASLIAEGRDYGIVFRIIRPDGEVRWLRSIACLHHHDGIPIRAVGFVTDITDAWRGELALRDANHTLEEERTSLYRKILEDPLTGIANRRRLDEEAARMWSHAKDSGQPLCLGLIDVDHFKQFNDRYGHIDGDGALREVAQALHETVKPGDVVARYGGEEFAFALAGTDDPLTVLEGFMAAVRELAIPHQDSPTGYLSISCGAVVSRLASLSLDGLFKISDAALYEAKQQGRNRHVLRTVNAEDDIEACAATAQRTSRSGSFPAT